MSQKSTPVTFDGAPTPGVINFGVGQPSADLLPVDLIRTATADFLARAHPLELNYGERQGDKGFRVVLADFLTTGYENHVSADSLFVTAGNSRHWILFAGSSRGKGTRYFWRSPATSSPTRFSRITV